MLGGVVVVAVVLLLAASRPRPGPVTPPTGSGGLIPAATATPRSSVGPTATSGAVPTPAPTGAAATPTATAPATDPPRATGDPRLAYAEFLLRVNDDRATVEGLNRALATAAEAQDPEAVRRAAVAILDFVDVERDWLREHPPAECYAAAHAAATAMLDAYGLAADRFIAWAATGGGLDGLLALGEALDAAQDAADALTAFGRALEGTTCPA